MHTTCGGVYASQGKPRWPEGGYVRSRPPPHSPWNHGDGPLGGPLEDPFCSRKSQLQPQVLDPTLYRPPIFYPSRLVVPRGKSPQPPNKLGPQGVVITLMNSLVQTLTEMSE